MFRVNLGELERGRTLRIEHVLAPDDPLWEGAELELAAPLEVELTLQATASGQVVGRGTARGSQRAGCRRCLEEVIRPLEVPLELVWSPPDQLSEEGKGEDEIRPLEVGIRELDVGEAVREEVILAAPRFLLCSEECRGLCPQCGANRNEVTCDCAVEEADPRWAALRALKPD